MKITGEHALNTATGVLITVFLFFFALIFYGNGGTEDLATFYKWLTHLIDNPLPQAYAESVSDYPPLFIFSFYPVAFLDPIIGLWAVIFLSLLLNLLLATGLVYGMTRQTGIALALYFSSFLSTIILKYTDINFMPALLISLWALTHKRYLVFSVFFTLACMIKWQPLIIAPFLLVYILNESRRTADKLFERDFSNPFYVCVIGASIVLIATTAFFSLDSVTRSLFSLVNESRLSANALNLHWLTTAYLHITRPEQYGALVDGISNYIYPGASFIVYAKIPFVIFYLLTLYAFVRSQKTLDDLYRFMLAGFFTYFMLNTGVHENHLYLAMMLALLLAARQKRYLPVAGLMILAMNINLLLFQGLGRFNNMGIVRNIGFDITLLLAALLFLFWAIYWYHEVVPALKRKSAP